MARTKEICQEYLNIIYQISHFLVSLTEATLNDGFARCRQHDDQRRVQNGASRQHGQEDHPEPQENVDLFVDNVQRQNAHGIVRLNRSRRTVLVERALCHARKHLHHRIPSAFLVHVREAQHIRAVRHKGTAQKAIHQHNVDDNIQKVEHLAEKVPKRVPIVHGQTFADVVHQTALARRALVTGQRQHTAQSFGKHAHLARLPVLPDHVRHIEADALEEQHERHPLVVAVERLVLVLVAQATLGDVGADDFAVLAGQRERVGDPAVGADDVVRN